MWILVGSTFEHLIMLIFKQVAIMRWR